MSVASYCRQPASTIEPGESLRSAAQRMEKEGMGCLLVASRDQPMGVLTDRDLALRVLAEGRDPEATCARDVLWRSVTTIRDTASLADASASMARHGLRRLPVVDEESALLGVIAADDVLRVVASEVVARWRWPVWPAPRYPMEPRPRARSGRARPPSGPPATTTKTWCACPPRPA
jgi:CBS domain-containing protein